MVDTTTQEYITRESPQIEAYKLGLLDVAKSVSEQPVNIPGMQIAGMSPQQQDALAMASSGIGAYQPYMNQASQNYANASAGFNGLPQYGQAAINYGAAGAQAYDTQSMGSYMNPEAAKEFGIIPQYGQGAVNLAQAGAQAYNPQSATEYMNPYQEQVTQNAMKEMQRQAAIQQQGLNSQAVKSGAFGGSRQGVQQTELGRNLYDVQSQRLFQDYANNYQQAQAAAVNNFQNQQARQQQVANTALNAGNLARGVYQDYSGNYQQAQAASMNAFQNQQARAQQLGNLALGAGNLAQAGAAGLAGVGQQTANLGQQVSGLNQGDTSFLYNIGEKQQAYQQKVNDAARQTALQQQYEPYQRVSFLSDIYKGAPSSQQTISQTAAPSPSLVSQIGGLGIAGLSAYNLFGKSGAGSA